MRSLGASPASLALSSSFSTLFFCNTKPLTTPSLSHHRSPLATITISCSSNSLSSSSVGGSDNHSSFGSYGSYGSDSTTVSPFRNTTVSVFWDLDNKPPKSSPYHAALYLRHAASQFGSVVDMVAYANRHAFLHTPEWVREQRQDRKKLDILEQRGLVKPEQPYECRLCGRKLKTNLHLKKHFKQLHEREQNKRMARLNSLKGRKRTKYRESIQPKTIRYKEAACPILVPKIGYGLESDLRRAGIFVRTVQHKPQAADIALKKQMADSMNRGIKCLCLVSDDTDFAEMLTDARSQNLRTVVFGESKSLKRFADFWFPWDDISQGVPRHDFDDAVRTLMQQHNSIRQQNREPLVRPKTSSFEYGLNSGLSVNLEVQHRMFVGSNPVAKASFSAFSEEEAVIEQEDDFYGSSSDDDVEWFHEDADGEGDDDWEDDGDLPGDLV